MNTERRTQFGVVLVVALLIAAVVVRPTVVPSQWQLPFSLGLAIVLALLAWRTGMTLDEVGLAPQHMPNGLRWGSATITVIAVCVGLLAALPATRGFFDDDRVNIGVAALLIKVLIVIPLGTVIVEEFAFRGVILGLLRRTLPVSRAVLLSSLLFGLWHVVTAWNTSSQNAALDQATGSTVGRVTAVVATVFATTIAGLVFSWLRVRSGSLLAPIGAHIATNSITFTAAWILQRN